MGVPALASCKSTSSVTHYFASFPAMKVLAVLLALVVAANAFAPRSTTRMSLREKRFWGNWWNNVHEQWNNAVNMVTQRYNDAKNAFQNAVSNVNFDEVVDQLVPMIHSGQTVSACVKVCIGGLTAKFPPLAVAGAYGCKPACNAALEKLEEMAG